MKKFIALGISAILISITLFSTTHATLIKKEETTAQTNPQATTSTIQYTPHEPIYITGNKDFTAENGVTRGSGTATDPYIIEGWEIDASQADPFVEPGAIRVKGTNLHFIIKDCKIHNGKNNDQTDANGVSFISVSHATIENCFFTTNHIGINLLKSSTITIKDSIFYNNDYGGFFAELCQNIVISHCDFHNTGYCVYLEGSSGITIKYNDIRENVNRHNFQSVITIAISSARIEHNNIVNNTPMALLVIMGIADARDNWWGSSGGPSIGLLLSISPRLNGDVIAFFVGTFVRFNPYYTHPISDAGPQ